MSRWHSSSCSEPDVYLDNQVPHCRACQTSGSGAISNVRTPNANSDLFIPPDETAGNLNLHWPSTITWDHPNETPNDAQIEPPAQGPHSKAVEPDETESELPPSPVYNKCLGRSEIRLISIEAELDQDLPIHISLEEYEHELCPEYETISYTWASEDRDNNQAQPIYIGPFWDVILQTRNFTALLRYLRPSRGLRLVWIDAISINQRDLVERNNQVARMGDIYRACTRAIVWLGHDLVDLTSTARKRFPLELLNQVLDSSPESSLTGSRFHIESVLKRKYFRRIWVIQELTLAPSSVFPIARLDFLGTHRTPDGILGSESQWKTFEDTPASWFRHMHQIAYPIDWSLLDILRQLSHSDVKATDPRDKIFGILGLIPHSQTPCSLLSPDYSISNMATYIGVTAHLLLNLHRPELLLASAGLKIRSPWPTWVPDWESDWLKPAPMKRFSKLDLEDYKPLLDFHAANRAEMGTIHVCDIELRSWSYSRRAILDKLWLSGNSVRSCDGGLTLTLVHILSFMDPPSHVHECTDDEGINLFAFRTKSCTLGIYTIRTALSELSCPGRKHLFMTATEENEYLMVLQETDKPGDFRLVVCFYCFTLTLCSPWEPLMGEYQEPLRIRNRAGTEYYAVQPGRSLADTKSYFNDIASYFESSIDMEVFLPGSGSLTIRDFLPLAQSIITSREMSASGNLSSWLASPDDPKFLELFQEMLFRRSASYHPKFDGDFVNLVISDSDWLNLYSTYRAFVAPYSESALQLRFEFGYQDDESGSGLWSHRVVPYVPGRSVRIKYPLSSLTRMLRYGGLFEALAAFSPFTKDTNVNEITLALRPQEEGDDTTYGKSWPQEVYDELGSEWRFQKVCIV